MAKGIVYFKDGHTEGILVLDKAKYSETIYFVTESGAYIYNPRVFQTDFGYKYIRHEFVRGDDGSFAPIDRIELV